MAIRVEEQKDYPGLLEAFRGVRARHGSAKLVIAGQGSLETRLRELVRELCEKGSVSLLGLRSDVPALLSAADGLVLSSRREGLPNVVMEALTAEVPVVATRVGGVPELVEDGGSGYLVSSGSPTELTQAMCRMMDLPSEARSRMGTAGRVHVGRNFGIERVIDEWEKLYWELLDRELRRRG